MSKSDQEVHTELCDEITTLKQRIKQLEELVDAIIGIDSVKQARNDSLLSHKDDAITLLAARVAELESKLEDATIECGHSLPELERMALLVKKIKDLETQLEFLKTELKALEDKE